MSNTLGNFAHRSVVLNSLKMRPESCTSVSSVMIRSSSTSVQRSSPPIIIKASMPFLDRRTRDEFSTVAMHASSSSTTENMLNLWTTNTTTTKARGSPVASPPLDTRVVLEEETAGVVDRARLLRIASRKSTPLNLSNMYRYASSSPEQRLRNAQFLHGELSIRVAQRAHELLHLPHGLSDVAEVQSVANKYLNFLSRLLSTKSPTNVDDEREFTHMLRTFVMDRASIPVDIASGLDQYLKSKIIMDATRFLDIEYALYRFFTGRVGLRFLIEHHILSDPSIQDVESYRRQSYCTYIQQQKEDKKVENDSLFLGCIHKNCNTVQEVQRVAKVVTQQCFQEFGVTPNVEVVDASVKSKYRDRPFTYVPHHLHYMLAELIKNSCRAVVRRHAGRPGNDAQLPPIRVVISKGAEDVTIKVVDMGGGIPRSTMKKLWSFVHSNVEEVKSNNRSSSNSSSTTTEPHHHHVREFGLPLARVYARYFGGELIMKSMEGHGVDAYLYLPVLGVTCEKVPDRETGFPDVFDFHEPDYEEHDTNETSWA